MNDVIKFIILKAGQFWEHSGIPVTLIRKGHSKAKLKKLIVQYESLWKHKTRKNFPAKSKNFLESLPWLFDIAHKNAFSIIQHDRCKTRKMILEDMQSQEDQGSCRKKELEGLDKIHFTKFMRKLVHKDNEIERAAMEKCHQEKASIKISTSTSLKVDDVDSIITGFLVVRCLDADTETDPTEDPKFLFPSTSSYTTGSTRFHSKSSSPSCSSITLKLPRNLFTSKIIPNMGDRLNLLSDQTTAFMEIILTDGRISLEKGTFSIKSTRTAGRKLRKSSAQQLRLHSQYQSL